MSLLPSWPLTLAAALLGAALAAGVQEIRVTRADARLASAQAEQAETLRAISVASESAALSMRQREQDMAARIEKETQDGQARLAAAQADRDAARVERDRLRSSLKDYRHAASAAAPNPGAAAASPATADALDLLAELFTSADDRAGDLAAAADAARAAGLTCERAYDALAAASAGAD
jgi:hypothetical protein